MTDRTGHSALDEPSVTGSEKAEVAGSDTTVTSDPAEDPVADDPTDDRPGTATEAAVDGAPADTDRADDTTADAADDDPTDDDPAERACGDPVTAEAGRTSAPARALALLPASTAGRLVAAALVACVLAGATAGVLWWRSGSLPPDAAFAVAGQVVTVDELDSRVQTLGALYGVEAPSDPAALDGFRRDAAKSVAMSTVLDRAAAELNIVIADKRVRDTLDRYVAQQFGPTGRDAFVQALGVVGTSEPAVLDEVRRQLAVSDLMDQVIGEVTVDDSRLRGAFDERSQELGAPERRTMRFVVVGSAADADSALAELAAGVPFEQVAMQRSLDAATRDTGGLLGEVSYADLEPQVAEATFAAPVGAPLGPVQTELGFYVGRVDAVTPAQPAVFEQTVDQLREILRTEEALARWRTWLADRLAEADVDYADEFRPADPGLSVDGSTGLPPALPPPR